MSPVYPAPSCPEQSRVCKSCGEEKPITEFYTHKHGRGGRVARCKTCLAVAKRARRDTALERERNAAYYAANAERIRARVGDYRRSHPDRVAATKRAYKEAHPERLRQYGRLWEESNRDKSREMKRAYYLANKDRVRGYQRRWLAENRDKDRARGKRRRARKLAAPIVDLTADQWRAILEHFGHRCAYCLRPCPTLQQEHMTPLSRGGSHTAENIVPACPNCNHAKYTRTLLEWVMVTGIGASE